MVNYQDGKIYKIVCNVTGKVYVGSTAQKTLAQRLSGHVAGFKTQRMKDRCTSWQILEHGNYDMVLLEPYPCNTKDELSSRERFYIESINCVNKQIPLQTYHEYYETHKEALLQYQKDYNKENTEKVAEKRKKYYEQNKETISQQHKVYHELHAEQVHACQKQCYENNKDKYLQRHKDWTLENKGHLAEYHKVYGKKYREENRDKINAKRRERKTLKKAEQRETESVENEK